MRTHLVALALLSLGASALAGAPEKAALCKNCHGEGYVSANAGIPTIAGQQPAYVLVQLYMFREGLRKAEGMSEVAKDLGDDDMRVLAEFLGGLPKPKTVEDTGEPERMARIKALIDKHHCASCHNPDFSGRDNIPRLAGQREDYLLKALRDYKSNKRAGYDGTMAEVLSPIGDAEIVDLAYYVAHSP